MTIHCISILSWIKKKIKPMKKKEKEKEEKEEYKGNENFENNN